MNENTTLEILYILGGFSFLVWGIATFSFGRITVKYLEREMAKEGIFPPILDKGIGGRIVAYAGIIVFPNLKRHASLVNIEATKRLSRGKDKKLAIFYLVSFATFLTIMFTAYFLFGPEN